MNYNQLGLTGWKISEVALGCWAPDQSVWTQEHDDQFFESVDTAIDNGINIFDTAECYGSGYSETLLGKALKDRRDKIYIASKVWFDHLKKDDTIKACEDSLRRLQSDYIDIYYIHYPDPQKIVEVEETMEAMLELQKRGLIRAIGISNFTIRQMKRVCAMGRVEVIQPGYSLLWRPIDEDIKPYCKENHISIIPYSPTGTGILTGKYKNDFKLPANDDRNGSMLFSREWFSRCVELADKLAPIARKYGRTSAQIAINWLVMQEGITSVLLGGKNKTQILQNLESINWHMDAEDWEYLDKISRELTTQMPRWTAFFRDLGCSADD